MLTRNIPIAAGLLALCLSPVLAQNQRASSTADTAGAQASAPNRFGLGQTPTSKQIAGWDIDGSRADGSGLPDGSGTVAQGKQVYEQNCVSCHGPDGQGPMDRLVGGQGTLNSAKPARTVGSYWPYATTLWDYIDRAMPFSNPHTLNHDQVYAVTAYVLYLNHLVAEDATMDRKTLPAVNMPNAGDFSAPDPRPDVHNTACMSNCPPLDVKPTKNEKPNPSQVQ
jgi:cytochrome c